MYQDRVWSLESWGNRWASGVGISRDIEGYREVSRDA